MDARFHRAKNATCFRCCIRAQDNFVSTLTGWINPMVATHESEALGYRKTMKWVVELEEQNVSFKIDSKILADAIVLE
jgi:hypothetical protein